MSEVPYEAALAPAARRGKGPDAAWWSVLLAAVFWAAAAALTVLWPDDDEIAEYTREFAQVVTFAAAAIGAVGAFGTRLGPRFARFGAAGPWLIALGIGLAAWEAATAKTGLLPRPFFVPPQDLLGVFLDDWRKLLMCVGHSVLLLASGYAFGVVAGFLTGLAIGWSKAVAYWGHPILRFIGPLPATAWLPVAFFVFPSSWSASVFLIALASGVPVAILTWSGVSSVAGAYYDIARTLGGKPGFLVLKVTIPAAMPSVFVGLFMGLSASFAVLVVAEMMGVKAGLGWYLQWAQGWAAYANMYAALGMMAVMCSALVALLFRVRGHFLAWQKGLLRW